MVIGALQRMVKSPLLAFKSLPVGLMVMLVMLFLWISADLMFGPYANAARTQMQIYFIMYFIAYVTTGMKPITVASKTENWESFLLTMLITGMLVLAFSALAPVVFSQAALQLPSAEVGLASLGFGALHALVKAYIEESVFRDVLPKFIGDYASAGLFGAFHLSVLTMITLPAMGMAWYYALVPVAILTILGLVWAKVRNEFGIMGATGSHFAWNLGALGALGKIFTGGLA